MVEHRMPTATHWGNYQAVVADGQVIRIEGAPDDPEPSPIGPGMVTATRDAARVIRPAVRRGWLEGSGDRARSSDGFVEVTWDTALDLVAGELRRVRAEHGDQAIYGGSYGWASAGRFHHPKPVAPLPGDGWRVHRLPQHLQHRGS
jgi:biotin/methionine sulfoxide reductase